MSRSSIKPDVDVPEWNGAQRPYDIIKEGVIALVVVALLTIVLAVVFGSPDVPPVTIKKWSAVAPLDFAQDVLSQLNGTSETATYGPPYNNTVVGQQLGPLSIANWIGVHIAINTVQDYVLNPLDSQPPQQPLSKALSEWKGARPATRNSWVAHYTKAAGTMKFIGGHLVVNAGDVGPIPVMMNDLLAMARSGAYDQALVSQGNFYTTNETLPLLFLEDGNYLGNAAIHQHLDGDQWGMMNETGNYPGQAWLWLYTFWYQVPPFNASGNGDILVWGLMMVLTLALLLVPFLPGIRSIPRRTRIYRLIWREHYEVRSDD